jgi:AAA+ superfamily predicted ATPase
VSAGEWHARNLAWTWLHLERLRGLMAREAAAARKAWASDPLHGMGVVSDEEADRLLAPSLPDAGPGGKAAEEQAPLAQARRWFDANGAPPALDRLGSRLGLDATDLDVVLLCLAPHLDPAFGRLYAYLQDDPRRSQPTPDLARRLLGPPAGLDRFLPDRPLRATAAVRVEGAPEPATPLASHALALDERVAGFLLGEQVAEPALEGLLEPVGDGPRTPAQEELAQGLVGWLRAAGDAPLLDLRGRPGSGRRAVAHAVAAQLRLRLVELRPERLPERGPERVRVLRLLKREGLLARLAVLVDAGDAAPPPDLLGCGALCIVASTTPWQAPAGTVRVDVPAPDAAAGARLWAKALRDAGVEVDPVLEHDLAHLAQQVQASPTDLPRLVEGARRMALLRGHPLDGASLRRACADHVAVSLGESARRVEPSATLDDLVLPADAKAQLREIVDQVRGRTLVYDVWGFARADARGRGVSVLFSGASGTGKTMAAEAIAGALGLELYCIDLATVVSKYVGETEKNLRRVFDAAERSGVVLLFDEADALFANRTEVRDSHDRYANLEVDYLLQRMEAYRGLAVLATNRKASIDAAFLRRLRFQVEFPFPDAKARAQLWRRAFPPAIRPDLDWEQLALMELTGAGIRNTALNAAFLAAARTPSAITHEDVLHAARREFAKLDRTPDRAAFAPAVPRGRA